MKDKDMTSQQRDEYIQLLIDMLKAYFRDTKVKRRVLEFENKNATNPERNYIVESEDDWLETLCHEIECALGDK